MARAINIVFLFTILLTTTLAEWPKQVRPRHPNGQAGVSPLGPYDNNVRSSTPLASGVDLDKTLNVLDRFWQLVDDINNNISSQYTDVNALGKLLQKNIEVIFPAVDGSTTIVGRNNFLNEIVASANSGVFVRMVVDDPVAFRIQGSDDIIVDYLLVQILTDSANQRLDTGFYTASTIFEATTCKIEYVRVDYDNLPTVYWALY